MKINIHEFIYMYVSQMSQNDAIATALVAVMKATVKVLAMSQLHLSFKPDASGTFQTPSVDYSAASFEPMHMFVLSPTALSPTPSMIAYKGLFSPVGRAVTSTEPQHNSYPIAFSSPKVLAPHSLQEV